MKIGIIGIGSLTLELARRSAQAGYDILIHNPRGNSLVQETIERMEANIELTTIQKAASADIILLFIPKDDLETVLNALPDMTGKIVVHSSNLVFDPQYLLSGITNALTYKITASILPTAHVVKLFNPIKLQINTAELHKKDDEIFFIADHADSKNTVRAFLKSLQFQPINLSGFVMSNKRRFDLKEILDPFSANLLKSYLN